MVSFKKIALLCALLPSLAFAQTTTWVSTTTYPSGALVLFNGTEYQSTSYLNQGNTPSSTSPYWTTNVTIFDQSLCVLAGKCHPPIGLSNPHVVTGDYAMSVSDLALVVNAASGAAITLPTPCQAGWSGEIVNASPVLISADVPNVITVQPGGSDVFLQGAAPLGGSGAFPYTLNTGTTKFIAIGDAGACAGWSWSQ